MDTCFVLRNIDMLPFAGALTVIESSNQSSSSKASGRAIGISAVRQRWDPVGPTGKLSKSSKGSHLNAGPRLAGSRPCLPHLARTAQNNIGPNLFQFFVT